MNSPTCLTQVRKISESPMLGNLLTDGVKVSTDDISHARGQVLASITSDIIQKSPEVDVKKGASSCAATNAEDLWKSTSLVAVKGVSALECGIIEPGKPFTVVTPSTSVTKALSVTAALLPEQNLSRVNSQFKDKRNALYRIISQTDASDKTTRPVINSSANIGVSYEKNISGNSALVIQTKPNAIKELPPSGYAIDSKVVVRQSQPVLKQDSSNFSPDLKGLLSTALNKTQANANSLPLRLTITNFSTSSSAARTSTLIAPRPSIALVTASNVAKANPTQLATGHTQEQRLQDLLQSSLSSSRLLVATSTSLAPSTTKVLLQPVRSGNVPQAKPSQFSVCHTQQQKLQDFSLCSLSSSRLRIATSASLAPSTTKFLLQPVRPVTSISNIPCKVPHQAHKEPHLYLCKSAAATTTTVAATTTEASAVTTTIKATLPGFHTFYSGRPLSSNSEDVPIPAGVKEGTSLIASASTSTDVERRFAKASTTSLLDLVDVAECDKSSLVLTTVINDKNGLKPSLLLPALKQEPYISDSSSASISRFNSTLRPLQPILLEGHTSTSKTPIGSTFFSSSVSATKLCTERLTTNQAYSASSNLSSYAASSSGSSSAASSSGSSSAASSVGASSAASATSSAFYSSTVVKNSTSRLCNLSLQRQFSSPLSVITSANQESNMPESDGASGGLLRSYHSSAGDRDSAYDTGRLQAECNAIVGKHHDSYMQWISRADESRDEFKFKTVQELTTPPGQMPQCVPAAGVLLSSTGGHNAPSDFSKSHMSHSPHTFASTAQKSQIAAVEFSRPLPDTPACHPVTSIVRWSSEKLSNEKEEMMTWNHDMEVKARNRVPMNDIGVVRYPPLRQVSPTFLAKKLKLQGFIDVYETGVRNLWNIQPSGDDFLKCLSPGRQVNNSHGPEIPQVGRKGNTTTKNYYSSGNYTTTTNNNNNESSSSSNKNNSNNSNNNSAGSIHLNTSNIPDNFTVSISEQKGAALDVLGSSFNRDFKDDDEHASTSSKRAKYPNIRGYFCNDSDDPTSPFSAAMAFKDRDSEKLNYWSSPSSREQSVSSSPKCGNLSDKTSAYRGFFSSFLTSTSSSDSAFQTKLSPLLQSDFTFMQPAEWYERFHGAASAAPCRVNFTSKDPFPVASEEVSVASTAVRGTSKEPASEDYQKNVKRQKPDIRGSTDNEVLGLTKNMNRYTYSATKGTEKNSPTVEKRGKYKESLKYRPYSLRRRGSALNARNQQTGSSARFLKQMIDIKRFDPNTCSAQEMFLYALGLNRISEKDTSKLTDHVTR